MELGGKVEVERQAYTELDELSQRCQGVTQAALTRDMGEVELAVMEVGMLEGKQVWSVNQSFLSDCGR